ncbi:MAG: hypothetical protein GY757_28760 [bacterium]|nr:hypothetical protein [bacterium]
MKKRLIAYFIFFAAAIIFIFFSFHFKYLSEEKESLQEHRNLKKKKGFQLPSFEEPFVPYEGTEVLHHDTQTGNLYEATGLDGMGKEEIAVFRLKQIARYSRLGIYESAYHPFKSYHQRVYRSITPGKKWLGPTPYYIANPYQLVILTCANHVTPLNLFCKQVEITYDSGVFEVLQRGESASCWFDYVYGSPDHPGKVWPVAANAWDAGFFYTFVDLARSENIKESDNPRHITNVPLSRKYFYHVGKYKVNNISPTERNAWLTLGQKNTTTVIYVKLWRNKPGDTSQAPDLVFIFKIIPH